jgi:hypothetical protein
MGSTIGTGNHMERRLLFAAVVLAWLALPLTALNFSRAWDRLPQRIAVHFDANWQPNGWTSREGARTLALGTTGFLLAVFTLAAFAVSRSRASTLSRWGVVIVFYIAISLIYFVNNWIVDRNLTPQSLPSAASLASSAMAGVESGAIIPCNRTVRRRRYVRDVTHG